jgi:hypothetical protein
MLQSIIRPAVPVMVNVGRAAAPMLREGALQGVQALAAVVVICGTIGVAAYGAYQAHRCATTGMSKLSTASQAGMRRAKAMFTREAPSPAIDLGNVVIEERPEPSI